MGGSSVENGRDVRATARRISPDLYDSVTEGPVSFEHLARARRIGQAHPRYREESRLLERLARERYRAENGQALLSEYWCELAYGGCALTSGYQLLSVLNRFDDELVVMQAGITQLARDVQRVFRSHRFVDERVEMLEALYSVMTRVMATADALETSPTEAVGQGAALAGLRAQWDLVRRRAAVLIQRQARFEYLVGVTVGVAAAVAVFAALGALATAHWRDQLAVPAFLAATLAGSVGALVSVVQRMMPVDGGNLRGSRHPLVLDWTAPRAQKLVAGATRPFVGAVFAAVVYFALLGGLLTIQGTGGQARDTPATFAFFGLMGFSAGFSERFATDVLERAGLALTASHPDERVVQAAPSRPTELPVSSDAVPTVQDHALSSPSPALRHDGLRPAVRPPR